MKPDQDTDEHIGLAVLGAVLDGRTLSEAAEVGGLTENQAVDVAVATVETLSLALIGAGSALGTRNLRPLTHAHRHLSEIIGEWDLLGTRRHD